MYFSYINGICDWPNIILYNNLSVITWWNLHHRLAMFNKKALLFLPNMRVYVVEVKPPSIKWKSVCHIIYVNMNIYCKYNNGYHSSLLNFHWNIPVSPYILQCWSVSVIMTIYHQCPKVLWYALLHACDSHQKLLTPSTKCSTAELHLIILSSSWFI